MLKTIIFDFDGTLVNSRDLVIEVYNELAPHYHLPKVKETDLAGLREQSTKEILQRLGIPLYKLPTVAFEFAKTYKRLIEKLHFFDDIPELLRNISSRGIQIAIISSNTEENIQRFLKNNQADHLIQSIASSHQLFGKDHTLSKFLKKQKLTTKEVIYVGDEVRDIMACQKLHLPIISVSWGFDSKDLLKSATPTYLVDHPDEIREIALKLTTRVL